MGGPSLSIAKSHRQQLRNSARVVATISCAIKGNCKPVSFSFGEGRASVSICNGDKNSSRTAHKSTYSLDWCYEEEKGVDKIYTKEVKPLIQNLFDGTNCCIISYGASSQFIQGSEGNQSLAEIAVSDILEWSNKNNFSIEISFYDVFQDQIYDLLRPSENEVLIYEDSYRQVQLKGLSKVSLKTFDELKEHVLEGTKHMRGYRGFIIYTSDTKKHATYSKINFLEFKGYGGAKVNKSLYSVMNVVHDLNSKNPVSYRGTKLTRFLQDFLSYKSGSLVIASLEQSDSEENKRVLTLASRSCLKKTQTHPLKKLTNIGTPSLKKRQDLTRTVTKANTGRQVNKAARKKPGLTNDSVQKNMSMQGETEQTEMAIIPVMQELSIQEESEVTDTISFFPSYEKSIQEESEATDNNILDLCGPCEPEESKSIDPKEIEFDITNSDNSLVEGTPAPPKLSEKLLEISNSLRLLNTSSKPKPTHIATPKKVDFSLSVFEPKTPGAPESAFNSQCVGTPHDSFKAHTTGMKKSLVHECLTYLNSANKAELKRLKGIGEIRATHILQLRQDSPEPFKEIKDLKSIGVTPKQFHKMAMNFLEES